MKAISSFTGEGAMINIRRDRRKKMPPDATYKERRQHLNKTRTTLDRAGKERLPISFPA